MTLILAPTLTLTWHQELKFIEEWKGKGAEDVDAQVRVRVRVSVRVRVRVRVSDRVN